MKIIHIDKDNIYKSFINNGIDLYSIIGILLAIKMGVEIYKERGIDEI